MYRYIVMPVDPTSDKTLTDRARRAMREITHEAAIYPEEYRFMFGRASLPTLTDPTLRPVELTDVDGRGCWMIPADLTIDSTRQCLVLRWREGGALHEVTDIDVDSSMEYIDAFCEAFVHNHRDGSLG